MGWCSGKTLCIGGCAQQSCSLASCCFVARWSTSALTANSRASTRPSIRCAPPLDPPFALSDNLPVKLPVKHFLPAMHVVPDEIMQCSVWSCLGPFENRNNSVYKSLGWNALSTNSLRGTGFWEGQPLLDHICIQSTKPTACFVLHEICTATRYQR